MDELREALADYAHEAWCGWMEYLFKQCEWRRNIFTGKVSCVISAWAVDRWTRQLETPYPHLPELEKDSDRAEAERILLVIRQYQNGDTLIRRHQPQSKILKPSKDKPNRWEKVGPDDEL